MLVACPVLDLKGKIAEQVQGRRMLRVWGVARHQADMRMLDILPFDMHCERLEPCICEGGLLLQFPTEGQIIMCECAPAGLDSFAALNVMEHMSSLANLGHTVIASIHQPRSAIWDMFDKVPSAAPLSLRDASIQQTPLCSNLTLTGR